MWKNTGKIVVFLLLIVMVIGCGHKEQNQLSQDSSLTQTKTDSLTSEPIMGRTATNPSNFISTLAPRVSNTALPEDLLLGMRHSDLLLSVNRANRYGCIVQGSEEIWLASYPYTAPLPLLASSEVDYRFPKWSPDGKWIAYVESNTQIIPEDEYFMQFPPSITGTDSVWIIHPDGSEKHRISDMVPSAVFSGITGVDMVCDIITEIEPSIEWSPDGKYIMFVQAWIEENMQWNYTYYLSEVNSGKTKILFTQNKKASILWIPKSTQVLIQGDSEIFTLLDVRGIDQVEIEKIAFKLPNEVSNYISYEFIPSSDENSFYGIFKLKDGNDWTNIYDRALVLNFDLNARQWNSIADIPIELWNRPNVFDNQILICDSTSGEIRILERKSWELSGLIRFSSTFSISPNQCDLQDLKEIHDESGKVWAILDGIQDKTQKGLWAVHLQPTKKAMPQLIFDINSFPENINSISYFAFQP